MPAGPVVVDEAIAPYRRGWATAPGKLKGEGMTNREELLTLVAAYARGGSTTGFLTADRAGTAALLFATTVIKAMDEVSATVNASQVDSSKDAEIARLLDACLRWEKDFGILTHQFAAYRSRMESPLTFDQTYAAIKDVPTGTHMCGHDLVTAWDAAIRKVREGRKP